MSAQAVQDSVLLTSSVDKVAALDDLIHFMHPPEIAFELAPHDVTSVQLHLSQLLAVPIPRVDQVL